jgi:hypothetical protein
MNDPRKTMKPPDEPTLPVSPKPGQIWIPADQQKALPRHVTKVDDDSVTFTYNAVRGGTITHISWHAWCRLHRAIPTDPTK